MLAVRVKDLAERAAQANAAEEIENLNGQLKKLSRILIPLTYTRAGQFDHDPAWPIPFLAGLQPMRELANLDVNGDEYQYLKTLLVRNCNAVVFALASGAGCFLPLRGSRSVEDLCRNEGHWVWSSRVRSVQSNVRLSVNTTEPLHLSRVFLRGMILHKAPSPRSSAS